VGRSRPNHNEGEREGKGKKKEGEGKGRRARSTRTTGTRVSDDTMDCSPKVLFYCIDVQLRREKQNGEQSNEQAIGDSFDSERPRNSAS